MNGAAWEITEVPAGAWYVQEEGTRRVDDEVLICEGLTKEQAMAITAASGRVFDYECDQWQTWRTPK